MRSSQEEISIEEISCNEGQWVFGRSKFSKAREYEADRGQNDVQSEVNASPHKASVVAAQTLEGDQILAE